MGSAFAIVERDGRALRLSRPHSSAAQSIPDGPALEPGGRNRLVVEVGGVRAPVDRLRAAGLCFRNEPLSGPGGTRVALDHPSGTPVERFSPRRPH